MAEHPYLLFLDIEAGGLPTVSGSALSFDFPVLCLDAVLWHPDHETVASSGTLYLDDHRPITDPGAALMHAESGLLERWSQSWKRGFEQVDEILVRMVDEIAGTGPDVLMAGNSVGGYDRPLVQIHFPRLHQRLSHRVLDTSSLRWPAANLEVDLDERVRATGAVYDHTSASDVRYSVQMYDTFLNLIEGARP